jgi:hypothetical protein
MSATNRTAIYIINGVELRCRKSGRIVLYPYVNDFRARNPSSFIFGLPLQSKVYRSLIFRKSLLRRRNLIDLRNPWSVAKYRVPRSLELWESPCGGSIERIANGNHRRDFA